MKGVLPWRMQYEHTFCNMRTRQAVRQEWQSPPAVHPALRMLSVFEWQRQHLSKVGCITACFLCFVLPNLPCTKQPNCSRAGYNAHKSP